MGKQVTVPLETVKSGFARVKNPPEQQVKFRLNDSVPGASLVLSRCSSDWGCARITDMDQSIDQSDDQIQYWVALNRVPRLGTVRFGRLEAYFGPLENAWKADLGQLKSAGIESRLAGEIVSARSRISPDDEMERLGRAGVIAINWHHADYPARLKEISNPPPVLYYKGTLLASDERSVAVVGTRSPTTYGGEAAATLTADLARCGITIVGDMALGIDGIAHHSALDQGARTIALLAGGLDIIYPREHNRLFQQIQGNGAVVSEIPLGVRTNSQSFPRRNRLISGISLGTLVV